MAYYDWENKDKLIEDLKASASISNFLDNQGLIACSGNYDTFKKWMKKHDINFQPLLLKNTLKKKSQESTKFSLEEIFIENSKADRNVVKRAIIKYELMEYECSDCGNCGFWNNKPLSLQLEHKNGDSADNRIKNLEYLCPNCHSQTPTYGSKNRHNRVFEQRIKDLEDFNDKEITYQDLIELSNKWNTSVVGLKNWITTHSDKLKKEGITSEALITFPKIGHVSKNNDLILIKERSKELDKFDELTSEEKVYFSTKWNISTNGLKKWIKKNKPNLYKNSYLKISNTKKEADNKIETYNKVAAIIRDYKNKEKLDLASLLQLFDNDENKCLSYLRRNFFTEYKYFYPTPTCHHCNSANTQRFGIAKLKIGNMQRYKCLDCSKQFY
jgi:5-methylcytosine-specific restriction endonuclease McrA